MYDLETLIFNLVTFINYQKQLYTWIIILSKILG